MTENPNLDKQPDEATSSNSAGEVSDSPTVPPVPEMPNFLSKETETAASATPAGYDQPVPPAAWPEPAPYAQPAPSVDYSQQAPYAPPAPPADQAAGYQQPGYPQQAAYGQQQPAPYGQQPYALPYGVEQKSKVVAGILGILLGGLGIHNFYLGKTSRALIQLLVSVLSFGILYVPMQIWGLVEGILILVGNEGYRTDSRGVPLKD